MAFVRVAEEFSRVVVRTIPDAEFAGEAPEELPAVAGAGTGPLIAVMPFEANDPDAPEELVETVSRAALEAVGALSGTPAQLLNDYANMGGLQARSMYQKHWQS